MNSNWNYKSKKLNLSPPVCDCWCLQTCSNWPVEITESPTRLSAHGSPDLIEDRVDLLKQAMRNLGLDPDKLDDNSNVIDVINERDELEKLHKAESAEGQALHKRLVETLEALNPETPDGKVKAEHVRLAELQKQTHFMTKTEAAKPFGQSKLLCGIPFVIESSLVGFRPVHNLIRQHTGLVPSCTGCYDAFKQLGDVTNAH